MLTDANAKLIDRAAELLPPAQRAGFRQHIAATVGSVRPASDAALIGVVRDALAHYGVAVGPGHFRDREHRHPRLRRAKKDRLAAVSPNRTFGSSGCALGFFGREVASNSIEHGHFSLVDRCDRVVDGERSVFVQQLGIFHSALNVQFVLPLGYFRL
jgi:hypothetical protein